jgi:uncharacterized protein (TIGR03066 family)
MLTLRNLMMAAIVAALALSLVGCSSSDPSIEGTWTEEESGVEYVFDSDGTMTLKDTAVDFEVSAEYEVDGDSLTVTFEGAEPETVTIAELTDSELVLDADDGTTITLTR